MGAQIVNALVPFSGARGSRSSVVLVAVVGGVVRTAVLVRCCCWVCCVGPLLLLRGRPERQCWCRCCRSFRDRVRACCCPRASRRVAPKSRTRELLLTGPNRAESLPDHEVPAP